MIHQSNRGFKKETGKPVNINISFTINPKNIVNNPTGQNLPYGRKLIKQTDCYAIINNNGGTAICPKTPELINQGKSKDKNMLQVAQKTKRGTKRNSIDETSFRQTKINDYNKSLTLRKFAQTAHIRKSSTKSKKNSEYSIKRHNKTTSNFTKYFDKYPANSVMIDGTAIQHSGNLKRNLKKMINNMVITNQLSKKSLPLQIPNSQSMSRKNTQKKKQKKKSPKKGKSETILHQKVQNEHRQKLIEKLTSFRSMNNSVFVSEGDEEIKPTDRRSIIVNTDQSIQCIDEIHEIEASQRYRKMDDIPNTNENARETIQLIQTYIAILNEHIEYEGQIVENDQRPIAEQFEQFQKNHQELMEIRAQEQLKKQFQGRQVAEKKVQNFLQEKKERNQEFHSAEINDHGFQRRQDELRPFCSSEMTKQQQLINQLERIKLNQLKKHEVEKWEQLLIFMKNSMEKGEADSEQILETVYHFLQKTRNDLQEELDSPKKAPSQMDAFTNKLASNSQRNPVSEHTLKKDSRQIIPPKEHFIENGQVQFSEISSMSFRDEDYEEQNEELKVLNLQMIDNALKNRYKNLVDRRDKELEILQEKRNCGKLSEVDFILQREKLDKWTKQQTLSISQARKNIWNGYNEAKGILQKSARSKMFQEECQSNKKKSMMKCLSQDYLLKKDINILSVTDKKKISREISSEESEDKLEKNCDEMKQSIDSNEYREKSEEKQQSSDYEQNYQTPESSNKDDSSLNKETIELNELKKEDDINVIEEKLKDIKEKRLKEDHNQVKAQEEGSLESPNMSYEEVGNQLHQSYSDEEMNVIRNEFENTGKLLSSQNKISQEENGEFKEEDYAKLRYICAQDKEDIFEFIFLDLSIELYQESCSDNKIMNAINNYVANAKRQANKKKGVKTNLNVVKEYLRRFSSFVSRAHKDVLCSIDQPVGPTAIQMLRYMHENEDEQPREEEEPPSTLIIPSTVFDQFQRQLLPSIQFEVYYQNDEEKENKRVQFLKSVLHIHNKALYDSMNEYLDTMRPFGIWGKPFPWKKASSFLRPSTSEEKEQKLRKSTQKVAEYCSYVCGLLVDKEESLVGNARLSQDYLDQIKEDRLSRMLATQLIQNEQRWLFYDDQETEVLVELSNAFYRVLLKQAVQQIFNIESKKE